MTHSQLLIVLYLLNVWQQGLAAAQNWKSLPQLQFGSSPVGQRGTESGIHPEANTITLLSQITTVITADPVEVPQIPEQ